MDNGTELSIKSNPLLDLDGRVQDLDLWHTQLDIRHTITFDQEELLNDIGGQGFVS